jgi:TPR repeat protein
MISKSHSLHICTLTMFVCLVSQSTQSQPSTLMDDDTGAPRQQSVDGHLKQELQLAGNYMAGRGVTRDIAQAIYWYRKAADQGLPAAQVQLGYFYLAGVGVSRDEAQAAKWFERAAASGSYEGKLNLAVLYLRGSGITHFPRAEGYLGILYLIGVGVEKDPAKAEKWFDRAARQDSPEGEYAMGTLYSVMSGHPHDFAKAADYLRRSAKNGYVGSMHSLGLLLVNHPEINQQPGEALHWLQSAAEGGAYRSSIVLGALARDGRGVPKDEAAAYQWFTIAVKQGGPPAEKLLVADLKAARKILTAEQQTNAEQAAQIWLSAHPHEDIFIHGNEINYASFPLNEVYATGQDAQEVDKGASTN